MPKTIYKRKEVRTLKELRYQKARLAVELNYMEERIDGGIRYYTEGGFLRAFSLGAGTFSSFGMWRDYAGYAVSGWKKVKQFIQRQKEKRAAKAAAKAEAARREAHSSAAR